MENDIEILLCEICREHAETPLIKCKCDHLFCQQCALYWKLQQDSCPFRCSKPWDICLPSLPDLSISASEEELKTWSGFICCPNCDRIGCLLCGISCRKRIPFSRKGELRGATCPMEGCVEVHLVLYEGKELCPCVSDLVIFYLGSCSCQSGNKLLYYIFCPHCQRKFCCLPGQPVSHKRK